MADQEKMFYQCSDCKVFFATIECFRSHSCCKNQCQPQTSNSSRRDTGIFCENCNGVFFAIEDLRKHEAECLGSTSGTSGSDTTGTFTWSRKATLLLISEYEKYTEKVEKGVIRKKDAWKAISGTLVGHGYRVSAEQVNGRWKTLLRGYKDVKDHNKKSGNSRKTYEYEEALDEIFGGNPTIQPKFTLSTLSKKDKPAETELHTDDASEGNLDDTSESNSTDGEPKSKKQKTARKSNASELVELVKTYISSREAKSEQEMKRKEEMHQATLDMMRALTQSLKK